MEQIEKTGIIKVSLLQELFSCCDGVYTWCFDGEGELLFSSCPDKKVFAEAFTVFGSREQMLLHAAAEDRPVFLGTSVGLVWAAAFEKEEGRLLRAWVLGPVFYTGLSPAQIEAGYEACGGSGPGLAWKAGFREAVRRLPVVSNIILSRYLLMLHYCLTGERLTAGDLYERGTRERPPEQGGKQERDRYDVYAAERALLDMVRNGDLNYRDALNASCLLSSGVPVQGKDPLRQAKTSLTAFATLVCRAAIEGGMSPEEAYTLSDAYIQSGENAGSLREIMDLPTAMYDDFIRRVHHHRTNPSYSGPVKKCVDYIEMHLGERIRASDLAALVGYEEYYITRRFKKETRISVSDYVKLARVDRAKVLLDSTRASVQEIALSLGFSTRSYFIQCFREVTGMTPAAWRSRLEKGSE